MNPLERSTAFIEGKFVDRVPFHPILMRFAARHTGVRYRDFCLSPSHKCMANIRCADDFRSDWVNTMSDPWAEAEAFGTVLHYPDDDLPKVERYAVGDISDTDRMRVLNPGDHRRMMQRIEEITLYRRESAGRYFICGWVEGPLAAWCDIRDINLAMTDLYEYPEKVQNALDIITESAIAFITPQVMAGAHCIGIGDSVCSLISPELYSEFSFEREKRLVDHIHSLGAYAKIHICGNISAILPDVIMTGADIIDIDHRTGPVTDVLKMLGGRQVFSGKSDPVSVLQDGDSELIRSSSRDFFREAGGRAILSAGCEVTPGTSPGNLKIFSAMAEELAGSQ
ncbi:MAG: uroporphyrinogen decarboxylase family protein [Bacteroidales bacterium]|jgi:uroporphyrinogen decarboxylase|nr:uroporphyrinogen decarboxylase family protein [Bacteroidales bacterium]